MVPPCAAVFNSSKYLSICGHSGLEGLEGLTGKIQQNTLWFCGHQSISKSGQYVSKPLTNSNFANQCSAQHIPDLRKYSIYSHKKGFLFERWSKNNVIVFGSQEKQTEINSYCKSWILWQKKQQISKLNMGPLLLGPDLNKIMESHAASWYRNPPVWI